MVRGGFSGKVTQTSHEESSLAEGTKQVIQIRQDPEDLWLEWNVRVGGESTGVEASEVTEVPKWVICAKPGRLGRQTLQRVFRMGLAQSDLYLEKMASAAEWKQAYREKRVGVRRQGLSMIPMLQMDDKVENLTFGKIEK